MENHYYHQFGVVTTNPNHVDHTIPVNYTTVNDLPTSGAFHILNTLRFSNDNIDYPTISRRVPVYFLDCDSCITNSSYGSYEIAGILGINIRGNVGNNNWDQWDSLVIFHELGHFFIDDTAQIPPGAGGSHMFTRPSASNNDLRLALSEGMATFFAGFILNSSTLINYAHPIPDTLYWLELERPKPDVPYYWISYDQTGPSDTIPYFEGAHVEGSVALSLWDLYDAIDDDNFLVGSDIWGHNDDFNSSAWWNGWYPIIEVFSTFDPQPDNPDHDYCWNIYEFIHGWRTLGYPVNSTFKNIFEAHNIPVFIPGDTNDDDMVNIFDITFLIAHLYKGGVAPEHMSTGDVNADCAVNIYDPTYLISYFYQGGPDLLVGCYNYYP